MLLFSGFCGESLWVSVGFFASASGFFFLFNGGGWDGYGFSGLVFFFPVVVDGVG